MNKKRKELKKRDTEETKKGTYGRNEERKERQIQGKVVKRERNGEKGRKKRK